MGVTNAFGVTRNKYIMLVCEVMQREVLAAASESSSVTDIKFIRQGLHSLGKVLMPIELQAEIDRIDRTEYDAILLCYGLCNYGIRGLKSDIPIVVPRAHDCITMLMGSKERYREYFDANPGTMYTSSGWIELGAEDNDTSSSTYLTSRYDEYVDKYGEEAAEYLKATLGSYVNEYKKQAFINTGTGDIERCRRSARARAERNRWEFEEITGDRGMFRRMLDGVWAESEFLVIAPGKSIEPSYDELIIKAV